METTSLRDIEDTLGSGWREAIENLPMKALSLDEVFDQWVSTPESKGMKMPWKSMQEKFGGLRPGELTILSGDTGMGKTTFAVNIMYDLATQNNRSMIFSLETGPIPIIKKIYTMQARCEANRENALGNYKEFFSWAQETNLFILDHYGHLPYEKLKMGLVWAAKKAECNCVLVDHFHSVTTPGLDASHIEHMVMELKAIAQLLNIALIIICHPSKTKGDSKERMIEMDDLKGSSGLKQYADNVMAVFYDKPNGITKVKLHKIRDDRFGKNMGTVITYMMDEFLTYQELDDGTKA